jgi:hypothetical protein
MRCRHFSRVCAISFRQRCEYLGDLIRQIADVVRKRPVLTETGRRFSILRYVGRSGDAACAETQL